MGNRFEDTEVFNVNLRLSHTNMTLPLCSGVAFQLL
jgi:hypothetical protein